MEISLGRTELYETGTFQERRNLQITLQCAAYGPFFRWVIWVAGLLRYSLVLRLRVHEPT